MSRRQYAKEIAGEHGPVGRLEVEHIGYSSMGDPEYRYGVYDRYGNILAHGGDVRMFHGHEADARQGMRVLLRFLIAAGAEFSPDAKPTALSKFIPSKAGAWAAAAHDELGTAAAEIDAELSTGLDQ